MSTEGPAAGAAPQGQVGLHPRLEHIVLRHARTSFRRPIAAHTQQAFDALAKRLAGERRPLVLDAGCGTGTSTARLAEQLPGALVLGVDRSAVRLARGARPVGPPNRVLVRADLVDFWRLAAQAGWRLARHCLFYPNPYPKAAQVRRRWHAHPVFPTLLALGGQLELRTNWLVYAREMQYALALYGIAATLAPLAVTTPVSPFERKYAARGHPLWQLTATVQPPKVGRGP